MTLPQQKEFVRLISQGASPSVACSVLEVPVDFAFLTYECDPRFRRRLETTYQSLTDNVRAALYREAIKGKVTAQTFWLRGEPPQRRDMPLDTPQLRQHRITELERIMGTLLSEPPESQLP